MTYSIAGSAFVPPIIGSMDRDLSNTTLDPDHSLVSAGTPLVTMYDSASTTWPVVQPLSSMNDWTIACCLCHSRFPVFKSGSLDHFLQLDNNWLVHNYLHAYLGENVICFLNCIRERHSFLTTIRFGAVSDASQCVFSADGFHGAPCKHSFEVKTNSGRRCIRKNSGLSKNSITSNGGKNPSLSLVSYSHSSSDLALLPELISARSALSCSAIILRYANEYKSPPAHPNTTTDGSYKRRSTL